MAFLQTGADVEDRSFRWDGGRPFSTGYLDIPVATYSHNVIAFFSYTRRSLRMVSIITGISQGADLIYRDFGCREKLEVLVRLIPRGSL